MLKKRERKREWPGLALGLDATPQLVPWGALLVITGGCKFLCLELAVVTFMHRMELGVAGKSLVQTNGYEIAGGVSSPCMRSDGRDIVWILDNPIDLS